MIKCIPTIFLIFLTGFISSISGQIVINEVLSSNTNGIVDEDHEFVDWIELYNSSDQTVNLNGYVLNDEFNDSTGWLFPSIDIEPHSFLLVYASGKDRKNVFLKSKTIINEGDEWKYQIPVHNKINADWRRSGFDDSDWVTGQSGFGYGDDDDNTVIQPLLSIYIRKQFSIEKLSELKSITLHVDFDDAFIAFINGVVVGQENVRLVGTDYDNIEVYGSHEAQLHNGGYPNKYEIDINSVHLIEGENVIALQGYNSGTGSSDFSLIPFLTIQSTAFDVNDVADFISLTGNKNLHTDFKVNNKGESLYLFNAQLEVIDSVNIVELPSNVSYGRHVDGNTGWYYFTSPTPGGINVNPVIELRADSLSFSLTAGFYDQAVPINITSQSDVDIRYTLDGTEPTINSRLYDTTMYISRSLVIKAAPFFANAKSGETCTQTYFIGTKHRLPVISLSTDPKNFFDWNEGILVEGPNAVPQNEHPGANYWKDWEKLVHFEYFDEDGKVQINQDAGVKIVGGWSRVNAQKSMALFARRNYGKGSFDYPFFKNRNNTKYEALLFRNSGNDWSYTMLRDGYVSEVVKNMDVDRLAYQPVVVYLNGNYWGILNMREKPNEHYFAYNYGVSSDNLNLLENEGVPIVGSNKDYYDIINFIENKSILTDKNYSDVIKKINVDCFIDYELIQIFINNRDWPGNNIKYWNTGAKSSKFRWLLYDTDFGLGLYGDREYEEDGISFATYEYGSGWPNPAWSTLLLRRLLSNPKFKFSFINRMSDLINSNFAVENMNSKLDSVSYLIKSEIEDHKNLWGHNYSLWSNHMDVIKLFNEKRPRFIENHFLNYFGLSNMCTVVISISNDDYGQVRINKVTPEQYPYSGVYFSDIPINIKALPKPGYTFVRWENDANLKDAEINLKLAGTTRLHAVFEKDQSRGFNVVINEINYQSDDDYDSGDWIEIYNNGTQTIGMVGWQLSDSQIDKVFTIPEGVILYPNNYLVICNNIEKFKLVHPEVENVIGDFEFGLSNNGDIIKLFDAESNIVDQVLYETKMPWPVDTLSTASTLELIEPESDNNVSSNWTFGRQGGTPGFKNGINTSAKTAQFKYNKISCFPTYFSDYTTLRFNGEKSSMFSVQIIDMQGRIIQNIKGKFLFEGTHYLDIFTNSAIYAKGVYIVKVQTALEVGTVRVIKH